MAELRDSFTFWLRQNKGSDQFLNCSQSQTTGLRQLLFLISLLHKKNHGIPRWDTVIFGGVGEIRTLEALNTPTRFPVVLVMTTSILLQVSNAGFEPGPLRVIPRNSPIIIHDYSAFVNPFPPLAAKKLCAQPRRPPNSACISFCRPQHIFPSGHAPAVQHVGP